MNAHHLLEAKKQIVTSQAILLAKYVRKLLDIRCSDKYLATIYVPFLSHVLQFNEWRPLIKPPDLIFKNFDEFLDYIMGSIEVKGLIPSIYCVDLKSKEGEYDLVLSNSPNIYEKLIYKILGISYAELEYIDPKNSFEIKPDISLRSDLQKLLFHDSAVFPNPSLLDFLPLTLLENLKTKSTHNCYPSAKVHFLGEINNENYLFYLAYLKDRGTQVIGEVHGGMYCQTSSPPGSEIAESILSDRYHTPSWDTSCRVFPNTRASRNLFINIKNNYCKILNHKAKANKMLVSMGLVYNNQEPLFNKALTGDLPINQFYRRHLLELSNHFDASFDFKLHPVQKSDSFLFKFLNEVYPDSSLITEGSIQSVASNYCAVIHLSSINTAIMELSVSRIPQYVYLGPEVLINMGYECFLWNTRLSSTKGNSSCGTYVQVNNKKYRAAYGASYLYPFRLAQLIKRLAKSVGSSR